MMRAPKKRTLLAGAAAFALSSTSAFAADVPVKAPKAAAALHDWTGWYGGYYAGLGVSQTTVRSDSRSGSFDISSAGPAGGLQGGYNWQLTPHWVGGVEGDIGHLGIDRALQEFDNNVVFGRGTSWYGTIRGRLGLTSGPSLFYATGGVAFVKAKGDFDVIRQTTVDKSRSSTTAIGWTLGGGIETLLGNNWSAKVEYLYIDAGVQNVFNPNLGDGDTAHFDSRFHIFRYGLNYKFGSPGTSVHALPVHNWTGFHFGVNAGPALSQVKTSARSVIDDVIGEFVSAVDVTGSGVSAAVQAGYTWHLSRDWVAGLEADIGNLRIAHSFRDWDNGTTFGVKAGWYGTARARLGYSTGQALLYATGGAAFVDVKNESTGRDINDDPIPVSTSKLATGWTLGAGVEAVTSRNWTAKAEYLFVDAGSQNLVVAGNTINVWSAQFNNRFHVFRFGLNYRFGS
jgi:outer membrane immunogenic protein